MTTYKKTKRNEAHLRLTRNIFFIVKKSFVKFDDYNDDNVKEIEWAIKNNEEEWVDKNNINIEIRNRKGYTFGFQLSLEEDGEEWRISSLNTTWSGQELTKTHIYFINEIDKMMNPKTVTEDDKHFITERLKNGIFDYTSNEYDFVVTSEFIDEKIKDHLKSEEILPLDISTDDEEPSFFVEGIPGSFTLYKYESEDKDDWCIIYNGWDEDEDGSYKELIENLEDEYIEIRVEQTKVCDIIEGQELDNRIETMLREAIDKGRYTDVESGVLFDILEQKYKDTL